MNNMKLRNFTTAVRLCVAAVYVICFSTCYADESIKTLGDYLKVGEYSKVEIRFSYYGWRNDIISVRTDPPFEAIIRADLPAPFLREVFALSIKTPAKPVTAHVENNEGAISIILEKNIPYDLPGFRRTLKIIYFRPRSEVWFDDKFWVIDDRFWTWMRRSFQFSGIDLHTTVPESHDKRTKR